MYKQQDANRTKTFFLMTIFLVAVIFIGWVFSYAYDNPLILYGFIAASLIMNFFSYWYSDKIVLSMYKATPVTNESHPDLYNIVENLSITAGIPMPKVYVIPESQPNAFATGRNKTHAAIAVTQGLLQTLDRTELEGVIAHEISHINNLDILLSTVVVILVGFVTLVADFFIRSRLMGIGGDRREGGGNVTAILFIVGIIFSILSPIFAVLLQLAISRKREYLADASGALLTRYPEGLASALEKIAAYGNRVPMARANHATAHLFISNPFGGVGKKVGKLFMTHPPIEERVKILRGMGK